MELSHLEQWLLLAKKDIWFGSSCIGHLISCGISGDSVDVGRWVVVGLWVVVGGFVVVGRLVVVNGEGIVVGLSVVVDWVVDCVVDWVVVVVDWVVVDDVVDWVVVDVVDWVVVVDCVVDDCVVVGWVVVGWVVAGWVVVDGVSVVVDWVVVDWVVVVSGSGTAEQSTFASKSHGGRKGLNASPSGQEPVFTSPLLQTIKYLHPNGWWKKLPFGWSSHALSASRLRKQFDGKLNEANAMQTKTV